MYILTPVYVLTYTDEPSQMCLKPLLFMPPPFDSNAVPWYSDIKYLEASMNGEPS